MVVKVRQSACGLGIGDWGLGIGDWGLGRFLGWCLDVSFVCVCVCVCVFVLHTI